MTDRRLDPAPEPGVELELRQVRQAVAVAELGSVAAAAAQLRTSPSSVSRGIAAVEKKLGVPLFTRSADRLLPTDLGHLFVERGRSMIAVADDLDRYIRGNPSMQGGALVVGLGTTASEATSVAVLKRLFDEAPTLSCELRSSIESELIPAMRQGALDVLVADGRSFADDTDYQVQPLAAMPMAVVVRSGHPLAARDRFEMADIFQYPVLSGGRIPSAVLDALLREQEKAAGRVARTRPMPAFTGSSVAMKMKLVMQSDAVCACSPALAKSAVASGQVAVLAAPAWLWLRYALVRSRAQARSPAGELFCRHFAAAHEAEVAEAMALLGRWLPEQAAEIQAAAATSDRTD